MNTLWAVGGGLTGLVYALHEHGAGRATWREVLCMLVLAAVVGAVLADLLAADWSSTGPPQDHFG